MSSQTGAGSGADSVVFRAGAGPLDRILCVPGLERALKRTL